MRRSLLVKQVGGLSVCFKPKLVRTKEEKRGKLGELGRSEEKWGEIGEVRRSGEE